jgi:hypothetical protein
MNRSHAFSAALAVATLGLTACGGSDAPLPEGSPPAQPPAAVACTAPDTADFAFDKAYASVCIPATTGGGSSRYDLDSFGSGAQVYKMDFSNATCTGVGTQAGQASVGWTVASGTTTVASLAADGITPVTGSARSVTVNRIFGSSGTFTSGTPLVTTGTYSICKTTPASSATARQLPNFTNTSDGAQITATFVLRSSAAGATAINTAFGFEGGTLSYYD